MKNIYRVLLIGLILLGIVYAGTESEEKKTEEEEKAWKYEPIDICKFPVYMDVGHFIQLKECHKRKIELKQVDCEEIGKDSDDFPCYKGSDVIEVRANFPAIFSASINKNCDDGDLLQEVNLYWENGVNTIKGCTGGWEKLKLCLEVCNVDYNNMPAPGTIEVGEITIQVKPPDASKDDAPHDPNFETEDDTGDYEDDEKSED
jgi:hypothetical protein